MSLHMRRRLAKIFTERGQDCMLALTLWHDIFMNFDRVKTGTELRRDVGLHRITPMPAKIQLFAWCEIPLPQP